MVLPQELAQMAQGVSTEKRNEVQNVLKKVFDGVAKMREQLDNITVLDEKDKVNMKLSNTIRMGVRDVRLDAEKTFDAKRNEVQQQMAGYKTEDALWLKSKQVMQILTKEIEETARWKEETAKRFEAEKAELKAQERILIINKFNLIIPRSEFENVSDEMFKSFVFGLEKDKKDKEDAEARAEQERIARLKADAEAKAAMESENKRLKEEAETKEKATQERIEKEEKERIAAKAEFEKRLKEESDKIEFQRKANEKLQAEISAKAESEAKAIRDSEIKAELELKEKQLAEVKAAKAPKKQKLNDWVDSFSLLPLPNGINSDQSAIEIIEKFEAFKKWAKNKIEGL